VCESVVAIEECVDIEEWSDWSLNTVGKDTETGDGGGAKVTVELERERKRKGTGSRRCSGLSAYIVEVNERYCHGAVP